MIHSLRVRLLVTLIVVVFIAVGTVALLASRVSSSELQRYVDLDMQRNRRVMDTLISYYKQNQGAVEPGAMAQQMEQVFGERVLLTDGDGRVLADSRQEFAEQTLDCNTSIAAVVITLGRSNCVGPLEAEPIRKGQIATHEVETGDILFVGVPFSDTVALQRDPISATLTFNAAVPQIGWTNRETMAFSVGAGPQIGDNQLPAITIRRTQGRATDPIQAGFAGAVNRALLLAAGAAGLAALLATVALSRGILGPVEELTAAALKMEKGDLSQRVAVRTNDEIGALAHAFNAMAGGLERIEQLRRHMVTDVAHELRTPLTNIRGYIEAVRDGVVAPDPKLIDSLHEEALLLNRLIDDLQDLALAEAGRLRLARRPIDIAATIESAVSALRPALAEKQLAVAVELPDDLPYADADAERVGQVLRNLLNNAVIHTPPGGAISVEAKYSADCRPVLSAVEGLQIAEYAAAQSAIYNLQSAILVSVRDSGPGIAPEHLPLIFERFFRADAARARATGGAGLGLTIVRQLVEAHGGHVWADSAPGQGATFTFALPVARR
jgi:signal transduction histidine kinase